MTDTNNTDGAALLPVTQAGLFPRIVTHEQARQAAKNFIDAHFNNPDGKGVLTGIPARDDHDDIVLTDYIKQQAASQSHSLPGDVGMRELIEALRLADALLRGANMDRPFVERKVSDALAKAGDV